jgi:hypothetical protein
MSDQKEQSKPVQKVREIDEGKAVAFKDGEWMQVREGVKPSAPANFALPKPVAIPPAPAASEPKNQGKK